MTTFSSYSSILDNTRTKTASAYVDKANAAVLQEKPALSKILFNLSFYENSFDYNSCVLFKDHNTAYII